MSRSRPLDEAAMSSAEARIPQLATQAGRAAHQRAVAQSSPLVMKSAQGQLVVRQAGGAEVVIKNLPATTPVRAGTVLKRGSAAPKKASAR